MIYFYLALAIVFEVAWAVAMKMSDGMSRLAPTIVMIVCYLLSVVFLAFATKKLDVGLAYAIWAGSGAAVIAVIGVLYFKEPLTILKAASLALIVAGIVGLQITSGGHGSATVPAARTDVQSR
jgi:small multidrug resistance pump